MTAALNRIVDQVRAATADKTALRIRGGGSKDFYWPSGAPEGGAPGHTQAGDAQAGTVLDTLPMHGITSYEPSELVVTVRAGTPLAELEAALAAQGQCLPFEPPHFGDAAATVGGMVAAGLSGPARASAGGVRDYVLGLELLNGRAELLRFGGTVMKNVAGYDVSRLMVGAMGTLGLITEVSLKVLPVTPAEATLVFAMDQTTALKQLNQWGGQPLPLNASRWQALDGAQPSGMGQLHLRLRGAAAAVQAASEWLAKAADGHSVDQAAAALQWQQCRDLKLPFFAEAYAAGETVARVSVAQTAPALVLPCPQLVEWHGALRWVRLNPYNIDYLEKNDNKLIENSNIFIANNSIYSRLTMNKKSISLERKLNIDIQKRLKAEFDPDGLFNRGRLHADF